MGGSALLIYGTVAPSRLQPRPVPRTVLDRVLGRERTETPAWQDIGPFRRTIDVPASPLEPFVLAFRQYVRDRCARPWPATRAVLDYLDEDVITLYVRGDADRDQPAEWYVQLTFSGCAGMAEVSAELAAHWAAEWYRSRHADLRAAWLAPFGFEPNGRVEPDDNGIFLPAGSAGYARVGLGSPGSSIDRDEAIELDAAAMDALDDTEQSLTLSRLRDVVRQARPDRCLCQLCAPDVEAGVHEPLPSRP